MLDPLIVVALVALLSALVKQFLPQFPISDELITAIVVTLASWLGLEIGKAVLPKVANNMRARGLMK
jgi:hypothetical protein